MAGADVFLGCSVKGMVTPDMVRSMASDPIVFALANPDPEISYPEAAEARADVIMATGRCDYPNQVNNVLGFPFIFRGALDVRATADQRGDEAGRGPGARGAGPRGRARVRLPRLRRRALPRSAAEYIIPKPFDPRVLLWVAPAVAKAAMDGGVARTRIDLADYVDQLRSRQSRAHQVLWSVVSRARKKLTRIAFPEGHHPNVQQAAAILREEAICEPVLLGPLELIRKATAGIEELEERPDHRPAREPGRRALRAAAVGPAPAARGDAGRRPAAAPDPQLLRRGDAGAGRGGRAGDRRSTPRTPRPSGRRWR